MSDRRPVPHYEQGKWQAIDVIEGMMPASLTPFQGHLWGCAMKYLLRAAHKGDAAVDLHKAETYTRWLRESMEKP